MTYQEEGLVRLRRLRTKQAIALAMQSRWKEAVAVNKGIIESFPNDIDAHNRLGRAYMELGEYSQAREAYKRAIELAPYNTIAKKNLHRLSHLGETLVSSEGDSGTAKPHHFIEETGRAGVVNLHRLAPIEILAKTVAGSRVNLKIEGPRLIVENRSGEYLGQVEPKHGQRLIKLMEGGNKYSSAIVSSTEGVVTLIIREVYQDPAQAGRHSFPAKEFKSPRPYITDKVRREMEEYDEGGEEEPGYSIVGGGELELSPEDISKLDTKADDEEVDNEEE